MLHILVVEDSPSDVRLIREAIRMFSIPADVQVADDGEQALRLLNSIDYKPDFILLDINLPKFTGIQILERYRADEGPPVVVFTSSENPADRERAVALGAKEYLVKPFEFRDYMQSIRDAISRWTTNASAASTGG